MVYIVYTRIYTINIRYINKLKYYIFSENMKVQLKHDATKKYRDIAFGSSAEKSFFAMEARTFRVSCEPRMQ